MLQSREGSPTHRRASLTTNSRITVWKTDKCNTWEWKVCLYQNTRDLYLYQTVINHERQQDNPIHRKSRYNTVMDQQSIYTKHNICIQPFKIKREKVLILFQNYFLWSMLEAKNNQYLKKTKTKTKTKQQSFIEERNLTLCHKRNLPFFLWFF